MKREKKSVESRNEVFSSRVSTRIWQEQPSDKNPYIAANCRCYGYDLLELMDKRRFVDVIFLIFRGELPTTEQSNLLEHLMIALINPGPRHPATRAAMLAGVGKTDPAHILPISLSILGGAHLGANEVEEAIRFFRKHTKYNPSDFAKVLLSQSKPPEQGDWRPIPGFGTRFGGTDEIPRKIIEAVSTLPGAKSAIPWGCAFANALLPHGLDWLYTGVAAAIFADLGFQPRAGAGLFQIFSAPGLLAHGLELSNKPITAMPFLKDKDYKIET